MAGLKKLRELTTKHAKLPLAFVGSAYDGVGLNDAIMSSKTQVQSVFSNKCGEFSMQFVCVVEDKKSFNSFLSKFNHKNLLANDRITEDFFLNYLQ